MIIDLDSILNVKLTSEGKAALCTYYYQKYRGTSRDWGKLLNDRTNEEGIYSFTLGEFMQIFGKVSSNNLENCFESIEIFPQEKKTKTKILNI